MFATAGVKLLIEEMSFNSFKITFNTNTRLNFFSTVQIIFLVLAVNSCHCCQEINLLVSNSFKIRDIFRT